MPGLWVRDEHYKMGASSKVYIQDVLGDMSQAIITKPHIYRIKKKRHGSICEIENLAHIDP